MADRARLEAKHYWQCTVEYTRKPGSFDCLMRTCDGRGFFWWTPDYEGMFAWGATRDFTVIWMADSLRRGYTKVVAGTLPECVQEILSRVEQRKAVA